MGGRGNTARRGPEGRAFLGRQVALDHRVVVRDVPRTGASGRASGYGAPPIPPVPNALAPPLPDADAVHRVDGLLRAPLPQAAKIAAIEGSAMPAAAAR